MATSVQQDVVIEQTGDKFLIKILNVMCTRNTEFTVGQEFDYEAHGGIRTKVSWKTFIIYIYNKNYS